LDQYRDPIRHLLHGVTVSPDTPDQFTPQTQFADVVPYIVASPDGNALALVSAADIIIKDGQAMPVSGTAAEAIPVFSPDSAIFCVRVWLAPQLDGNRQSDVATGVMASWFASITPP